MNHISRLFLVCLFLSLAACTSPGPASAQSGESKKASEKSQRRSSETTPQVQKIKKDLSSRIPKKFCEDDQYFRKCYKVPESHCVKTTQFYLKTCLSRISSPKEFTKKTEANQYGTTLGKCLLHYYHKRNKKYFRNIKSCQRKK